MHTPILELQFLLLFFLLFSQNVLTLANAIFDPQCLLLSSNPEGINETGPIYTELNPNYIRLYKFFPS